ncbi:Rieske [2Fe-2S] iron-sulfur domain-containing protein [Ilyonectria destructans]|nr:Rieske [2Fe-2S] iron-sulfur domain-containing protein [Ilyonectria destructans]
MEHISLLPDAFFCVLFVSISLIFWLLFGKIVPSSKSGIFTTRSLALVTNNEATKRRTLPQGWWTDHSRFQLERRAIFSKIWICVSHRGRFVNPGDYVSHELAGFKFFLILGKDQIVRTFHNVCRHRAFPVTSKPAGSSTVLGCKYHGWSYDTIGRLTKAPHFEKVPDFDKEQHNLFEIHTKVDNDGFVHINLSAIEGAGDTEFIAAKVIGRPTGIRQDSQLVHSLECKGKFNWKVAANEAGNNSDMIPNDFAGNPTSRVFRTFSAFGPVFTGQLHYFPLTSVYTKTGSPFWFQFTFSPESTQLTTLRCDVYSAKYSGSVDFEGIIKDNLQSLVTSKIQEYERVYAKLTGSEGHPSDGSYDETRIADIVEAHLREERLVGRDIKPATVQQCKSTAFTQAEGICQAMEDKLAW